MKVYDRLNVFFLWTAELLETFFKILCMDLGNSFISIFKMF